MENLNLSIKKFNKSCINKKYLSWINDKKLMRYSRHVKINYNFKNAETFYKKVVSTGSFFLRICTNFKMIGTIIVYNKKIPNIGILIGDNYYRGKGLAYTVLTKVLAYLKKKNIEKVEIGCNKNNLRMLKILKKLEFVKYKIKNNNIYFIRKI